MPRRSQITVEHDHELRLAAQAMLTTVRRIKGKIEDESDPAERRRLRRLLRNGLRRMRTPSRGA